MPERFRVVCTMEGAIQVRALIFIFYSRELTMGLLKNY